MTEQELVEMLDDIWTYGHEPTDKQREAVRNAMNALEELQQYRAIGTIQECRDAREKQNPVRPMAVMDKSGRKVYECGNCGNDFPFGIVHLKYCPWCGQAQDLEQ